MVVGRGSVRRPVLVAFLLASAVVGPGLACVCPSQAPADGGAGGGSSGGGGGGGELDSGFDAGSADAGFDAGPGDAGVDAGPGDGGFDAGSEDSGFKTPPPKLMLTQGSGVTLLQGGGRTLNALLGQPLAKP